VYPQNEQSSVNNKNYKHYYSLRKTNGNFTLRQGDTLKVGGALGLGLKVNDYLNGSANRCGVYQLMGFMDGELFFHEKFDGFSFGETRYINSLMDYEENIEKRRKLHKMFIEPNNKLSVYVDALNRGLLDFSEANKTHEIFIEAIDAAGNKSSLKFYVQSDNKALQASSQQNDYISIPWQNKFKLDTSGLQLSFDKASFYDTLKMEFSIDTTANGQTYSPVYHVHNPLTPIHKYFEIAIKYSAVADSLKSKLLLGYWSKDAFVAAGGMEKEGSIYGLVRELGSYSVLMDTIKPDITPLGMLAQSHELSGITKLQFIIADNLSGIASYKGSINGDWVLFEYDSKNNLISYSFDKNMPVEGAFTLKVEVVDKQGNKRVFEKEYEIYPEPDYDIGQ
jgi:flagellar hook protein FlgE